MQKDMIKKREREESEWMSDHVSDMAVRMSGETCNFVRMSCWEEKLLDKLYSVISDKFRILSEKYLSNILWVCLSKTYSHKHRPMDTLTYADTH